MLPAWSTDWVDVLVMLLDIDTPTLAKMADTLLEERPTWTSKQWQNQCRYFAALTSELECRAHGDGRHWLASEVHEIAWKFTAQAQ
jgi:hypothetical protein